MTQSMRKRRVTSAGKWAKQLESHGYCIIPDLLSAGLLDGLQQHLQPAFERTPFCEGSFYGHATKRFGRLLVRSAHAAHVVQHQLILEIVRQVLDPWCDTIQLNLTQGLALHPGALPQFPHRDQDMWQGEKGRIEYLVNVMWPLTPYTADNGATLIWPGSNGAIAVYDADPVGPPIVAQCPPGSAILFLGSTLHGAGGNRTDAVRQGLIVSYCLGWLKPYENQWLAYPPAIARNFPPELAALVGYQQHRPNLGNFEGQCPSILLGNEPPPVYLQAIDALRPEQQAALEDYVGGQKKGPAIAAASRATR